MLPNRKLNRLSGYDYSNAAYYFITIVARGGLLADIVDDSIQLNKYGNIVHNCWRSLFLSYRYLESDEFIILPDHLHAIVIINSSGPAYASLSTLIGNFKSNASRKIHAAGLKSFHWQRSFNDRIIRNEKELCNIRKYIKFNYLKPRS
jgi:putative transposase